MKISWLLSAALVGSAIATSTGELTPEEGIILEKRAFDAIRGVPGTAYPRLEIRDMKRNNPDQFNIFLLALQRFMAMDQNNKFSYYQIAGIHGRPFVQWNDVPGVRSVGGYCPHVSNMFLPWHRPYLALFEQQLLVSAQEVVNQFPESQRARWQNAKNSLRLPYWDSAAAPPVGECSVPTLIRDQRADVDTPSGRQSIANPLYSYNFHPAGSALGGNPFASWEYTWRRPVLPAATARSNNNEFCRIMGENRVSLRNRMYNLFTRTTLYRLFSTEATGGNTGNPESHDSVESVHDTVHIVAGGETGGHMYYLDYSAFDPVFWLHHCNMDRYGAMFQTINPNNYVESGAQTQNNFVWNAGDPKNWYSPLKPFTQDTAGNFWVPQTVRDTFTFNYYYPETPRGATADSVRRAVNTLYGPSSPTRKRDFHIGARAEDYEGHQLQAGESDYVAHVKCDKFTVGGSYTVKFYLGANNSTNSTIGGGYNSTISHSNSTISHGNSTGSYYVGMTGVLAPFNKMDDSVLVSSQVPLTAALQGKYLSGELSSLDEKTVSAYLEKNLYWEIVKAGGVVVPANEVNLFDVKVSSNKCITPGGGDQFPTYEAPKYIPRVTTGKPGGSDTDDDGSVPGSGYTGGSDETCKPSVEYQYVDEDGEFLYSTMGDKL